MTRINIFSKTAGTRDSVAWGTKNFSNQTTTEKSGVLLFAALLIVCSLAVGCNNDKPKPVNSSNQISPTPNPVADTLASSTIPATVAQPAKPAVKKVVKKRPATVTYNDKTYGVSFDYPRRYAIETGDAANDLVASSALPMNFVTSGGTALAAVELPETGFANTDFSSAYFNVSVNKSVAADDCGKFFVPAPVSSDKSAVVDQAKNTDQAATSNPASTNEVKADATPSTQTTTAPVSTTTSSAPNKLMLGDLEMQGTEAVSGEGSRQSDSKYFHVYQNGACYEFALNVTTVAAKTDAAMKHVDRDKVFTRLEQILSTVKIAPLAAPTPEVTASVPATPAASTETSTPDAPANSGTAASAPTDSTPSPSTPATPAEATTPSAPANPGSNQ